MVEQAIAEQKECDDQQSFNRVLRERDTGVRVGYLPVTFLKRGLFGEGCWVPGRDMIVPVGVIMHHACWTYNFEDKIKQLEYVRQIVQSRQ